MKDSPSPAKRRGYDAAFRVEALRLAAESRSTQAAARALNIGPQRGDWAYLCAYQDMVSKQVVGVDWQTGAAMPEKLTTTAWQRAFWAQPPTPGLLVHADRDGQSLVTPQNGGS